MNEVAAYQGNQQFSKEQIDLIRRTVAPGTDDDQFMLFLEFCKHLRLNPFARQIYAVVRNERQGDGWTKKMTVQTSIDGMRLLAERSGKYAGQLGPQWCGKDGEWKDVWISDEPPYAARVAVLRSDFKEPLWSVAKYASYVQEDKQGNVTMMWVKFPDVLLAKCAESLSLRRACPAELSGVYTREEMSQADSEHTLPAQMLAQETVIDAEVAEPASNGHHEPAPAQATSMINAPLPSQLRKMFAGIGKSLDLAQKLTFKGVIKPEDNLTPEECSTLKQVYDNWKKALDEKQDAAKSAV